MYSEKKGCGAIDIDRWRSRRREKGWLSRRITIGSQDVQSNSTLLGHRSIEALILERDGRTLSSLSAVVWYHLRRFIVATPCARGYLGFLCLAGILLWQV